MKRSYAQNHRLVAGDAALQLLRMRQPSASHNMLLGVHGKYLGSSSKIIPRAKSLATTGKPMAENKR